MNVVELIFAFWLGRATKGANPFVVIASFFLALILVTLMIGVGVAVWHYSPQARTFSNPRGSAAICRSWTCIFAMRRVTILAASLWNCLRGWSSALWHCS